MAQYESITHSRQDAFEVEKDLRSNLFEMQVGESAVKMAYHLCSNAALIGEFVISEEGKNEIISEAQYILNLVCSGRRERLSLMDGRVLAVACVLLTRNTLNETADEKNADRAEIWQPILEGLNFPRIADRTGCSEQVARKFLCETLKNPYNVRFFADGGKMYYNTLRLHALAPEWSIRNLYNVLYAFYHKNLECSYDPDSNVASMFVAGIRRRWENSGDTVADKQSLQSDQLASSLRELFLQRPHYMAAVCDALLERIDRIVQGDFTTLAERNRWDVLLLEWYHMKTAYERSRMLSDRKAAVKRKVVDRKENIRAEYRFENKNIYLCVPGIRLPEIRQIPVLQLYQNGVLVQEQRLSVYGDDVLLSTRPHKVTLNQTADVNWKKRFCFEIRILSGDTEIYRSGSDLFREYLCFTPAGNETRLIRCNQMLRLIVRKSAKLVIEDPEDSYSEEAAPYRSLGLWTESISRVTLNGADILEESRSGAKRIWAYLTPESDSLVTAKFGEETVAVYAAQPILHVVFQDQAEAKNYQLTLDGTTSQLYQHPWDNGQFRIALPSYMERRHTVQLKDFGSGEVVFERSYTIVPGLTCTFDRIFYLNMEFHGKLFVNAVRRKMTHYFQVQPEMDKVSWNMAGLTYEIPVPKVCVEINGKNAFCLSKKTWYEELKDSVMSIRVPEGVECAVMFGNKRLVANSAGHYEIGTAINGRKMSINRTPVSLLVRTKTWELPWKLTEICYREFFESCPVVQKDRQILWNPIEAGFFGGDEKQVFRLELENDQQKEPFQYTLFMKNDTIERHFPCRAGTYKYVLWLTRQRKTFGAPTDIQLLEGEITVEDPPEGRFENKHIILTRAYYSDPRTGADVSEVMRQDGALIDHIRYEGLWEIEGKMTHEYSGILYFRTAQGWKTFSDVETEKFEKINPVFFTLENEDHVRVYHGDDASLMLNTKALKPGNRNRGVQIYSRKNELDRDEQIRYLAFADRFQFTEGSN